MEDKTTNKDTINKAICFIIFSILIVGMLAGIIWAIVGIGVKV